MTTPEKDQEASAALAAAEAAEEAALRAAVAAEEARWAAVDLDDAKAVIRALAEVGMRAGVKASLAEHMHERIGKALTAFQEATAALATSEDVDRRIEALEDKLNQRRRRDKGRLIVLVVVLVLVFSGVIAAIGIAVAGNTAARHRQQEFLDTISTRQEVVAICTRVNGTEGEIRACIRSGLTEAGVPSRP